MIVLAIVEEGRPLPPGVTVLADVRATGAVTGRHAIDLGALGRHDDSMLLTIHEAADELRLSPRQVERLVKDGKLTSVLIGSARRIDRDDLRAFVVEHRQPSTFRDRVEVKDAPASGRGVAAAGRRAAGAGALPARAPVSPKGVA